MYTMFGIKHTEFLTFNNTLYQVHRKIPKGVIKENHILDVRDAWHCDTVLRTKNQGEEMLVFVNECPDAVIVEDTPDPTPAAIPESQDPK